MNMKEIREIAKSQGVKPGKLPKTKLIRAIQLEEGNYDCFATSYNAECNQLACLWREDCIKQTSTKAA
jgi:hypothetical protein